MVEVFFVSCFFVASFRVRGSFVLYGRVGKMGYKLEELFLSF